MDYSQIRRAALEALRTSPRTQWTNFLHVFGQKAHGLGFVDVPGGLNPMDSNFGVRVYHATSPHDKERLREVFWAFLIEGIIILGMDDSNPAWPWFRVTEYGERVLEAGDVIPHDPDGYLAWMRTECSPFDPIAEICVEEALQCFLRGNYIAAAVMLGVATQKLFLDLLNAFMSSLAPTARQRLEQATSGRPILRQWHELRRRLESQVDQLPPDLQEDLDVVLDGVFSQIRVMRNEAGHPTGGGLTAKQYTPICSYSEPMPRARRVIGLTNHFVGISSPA